MKTKKFKNGVLFKGEMVKEKRHGKGEQVWPDGRTYDGDWNNDTMHGRGTYKWPEGRQYYGDFLTDYMSGKGIYSETSPLNKTQYGEFDNTQLQGKGVQFITLEDKIEIKVGSSWNIGTLQNGFKIVTSLKDGQILEAFQYSNRQDIEWIPKTQAQEFKDEIAELKAELEKYTSNKGKKDDEVTNLKNQIQILKNEFSSQTKDLKESFQEKSELETSLYSALIKQKQLQDVLVERTEETERNLKEELEKVKLEKEELSTKLLQTTKLLQETNENLLKFQNAKPEENTNQVDPQIAVKLKDAVVHIEELQIKLDEQKSASKEREKNQKEKIQELVDENSNLKDENDKLLKDQQDQLEQIEKLVSAVKKKEEELKSKFSSKTQKQTKKTVDTITMSQKEPGSVSPEVTDSPNAVKVPLSKSPRVEGSGTTPRVIISGTTPQTPRDSNGDVVNPAGWKSLLKKTSTVSVEKKELPKINQVDFRSVLKKKSGDDTPRSSDADLDIKSPK